MEAIELKLRPVRELAVVVTNDQQQPVAAATVIATIGYQKMDLATTGDAGRAKLHIPADAELQAVVAFEAGVGLDYLLFRGRDDPQSDPYKLAPDHTQPLALVLNGKAVIERVRPEGTGGIPWFVFLDADGNPLINSDGPNGNVGFPGEPEGQVHFEKMLRTSPRHITDDEIKSLIADLAAKNQ